MKRFSCYSVPRNTATILLLITSIVFNCSGVLFSLLYRDQLSKKYFFHDDIEQSMVFIFVLIELVVFFRATISAFKKKSSMLTFATVMLLLESFYIIFVAVRIHHRNVIEEFWQHDLKPQITRSTNEPLKYFFKIGEDSVPLALVIMLCSILTLILGLKICTAMTVNNYNNHVKIIRAENMFYQLKIGREKPISRPTSYLCSTIPVLTDKHLYE